MKLIVILYFISSHILFEHNINCCNNLYEKFRLNNCYCDDNQNDTCIIEGMNFEIVDNGELLGLKAIIRNGRIRIVNVEGAQFKCRVIRYVFSIRRDEKISSVRNYGDLVSYPVINLLKEGEPGDLFYFEDIIIVNPVKEILDNAVKPIIIRKM